ncbi:MAG: GMC family oxidoreductase [Pirellulaceae bacterium]|nr:GMC family oxidoreductase [Pirellulaceae bacterium]
MIDRPMATAKKQNASYREFELSDEQRTTLASLCQTFNPKLTPEAGDVAAVFENAANDWRIVDRIVKLVQVGSSEERGGFLRLLDELGQLGRGWTTGGAVRRFSDLPLADRLTVVDRLLHSREPHIVAMVRSIQRLTLQASYSGIDGNHLQESQQLRELHSALSYGFSSAMVPPPDGLAPSKIGLAQRRLACDYLVIGSGAAGAVMAAELAETGRSVLLVDGGPIVPRLQLGESEIVAANHFENYGTFDWGDCDVAITAAKTFGGGPVVNWGSCVDPPERLLQRWAKEFGFLDGLSEDFSHSLYTVRRRLRVTSETATVNSQNEKLRAGLERLGWHWQPVERNAVNCSGCDRCDFGCPSGSRQDTRETYLLDAQRLGVHLFPDCQVERLVFEGDRAVAAIARAKTEFDPEAEIEIEFRDVVICAGAIHSPAILLRSGLNLRHLGKNLHVHPTAIIPAWYGEEINAWRGPAQSVSSGQFSMRDEKGHGFWLETVPVHPGMTAMMLPWSSPRQHKRLMQLMTHMATTSIRCHDNGGGELALDRYGRPRVLYRLQRQDFWNLKDGVEAGLNVQQQAGAVMACLPTWDDHPIDFSENSRELSRGEWRPRLDRYFGEKTAKLFSVHQFSTCRLAHSPALGVVDLSGRVYGCRNVYVTDASVLPTATGVNPMLTIITLSHFLAQKIKNLT